MIHSRDEEEATANRAPAQGAGRSGASARRGEHCSEDRQAREDCAHERRWPWRHGDRARGRSFENNRLALAGVFRRGRRRGSHQGPQQAARQEPISSTINPKIVEKPLKEPPPAAPHWSVREMGVSHTSVQRIWAGHGLKPHQVKSFKVSKDPDFAKKVEDIAGLYLDPPEKACCPSTRRARFRRSTAPSPACP